MPAPKGNTNASHRKKLAREALRLRIDGEKCLDELEAVAVEAISAGKDSVPALKLRADIAFGKLKKILPDLRATEHSGEIEIPLSGTVRFKGMNGSGDNS